MKQPQTNPQQYIELIPETSMRNHHGVALHRIRAVKDMPWHGVVAGDLGGWVESLDNIQGEAWVSEDAQVFGNALIGDRCRVSRRAIVSGNARIADNAIVTGHAIVGGHAYIAEHAYVSGEAQVHGAPRVIGHAHVEGVVSGTPWVVGDVHKNLRIGRG